MKSENNTFLIYQDDNGVSNVNVRFEGEDVWLASEQLAELFQTTQQNISLHVQNIYDEGEIDENRTHKKYLLVRNEGNRSVKRNISHYNRDMILAIGVRQASMAARTPAVSVREVNIHNIHSSQPDLYTGVCICVLTSEDCEDWKSVKDRKKKERDILLFLSLIFRSNVHKIV